MNIPDNYVLNVMHVLFGNQQQSLEFNKTVAISVIEGMSDRGYNNFSSLEIVNNTFQRYINFCLNNRSEIDYVLRFIIGIQSYDLLLRSGSNEVELRVVKPIPDSPKLVYRLEPKNKEAVTPHQMSRGNRVPDLDLPKREVEETLGEKAKRLHDQWVDCSPGSWITDPTIAGNTWAVAVLVADAKMIKA